VEAGTDVQSSVCLLHCLCSDSSQALLHSPASDQAASTCQLHTALPECVLHEPVTRMDGRSHFLRQDSIINKPVVKRDKSSYTGNKIKSWETQYHAVELMYSKLHSTTSHVCNTQVRKLLVESASTVPYIYGHIHSFPLPTFWATSTQQFPVIHCMMKTRHHRIIRRLRDWHSCLNLLKTMQSHINNLRNSFYTFRNQGN